VIEVPQPTQSHQKETISAEQRRLAEAVRAACIRAALAGYEDAGLSGLCHEGAWERAIDAIRELKLEAIIQGERSKE
jgi:hypothetical protein